MAYPSVTSATATQTKSMLVEKLWILCNLIIIGYIYVYYALVLLQAVTPLWLVMNTPLFKDQKNKTITTTK